MSRPSCCPDRLHQCPVGMTTAVLANRNPFQEHLRPPVDTKVASGTIPFKGEGFDYTAFEANRPAWRISSDDSRPKIAENSSKLANLG